jgi:hypothetical protein
LRYAAHTPDELPLQLIEATNAEILRVFPDAETSKLRISIPRMRDVEKRIFVKYLQRIA